MRDFAVVIVVSCMTLILVAPFLVLEKAQPITNPINLKYERMLTNVFQQEIRDRPLYSKLVTATAYTAREEECDATPEWTASMEPSRVGAIAVSRDLETLGLTFGTIVVIDGMGSFRVDDRMNARWTNRIDILHANLKAARNFAKRDVTIRWVGGKQSVKEVE